MSGVAFGRLDLLVRQFVDQPVQALFGWRFHGGRSIGCGHGSPVETKQEPGAVQSLERLRRGYGQGPRRSGRR